MRAPLAAVLLFATGLRPDAQQTADARNEIDAYRSAIRTATTNPYPGALEAALDRLDALRDTLMGLRTNSTPLLESMSDVEFKEIASLPGAIVNRDEVLFVNPDPDYFLRTASTFGDAADRAFFTAYTSTYPDSVWPAYDTQQTDYSGCTAFGEGRLVGAYRTWSDFRRTYPSRYRRRANAELEQVGERLTESTCACGDKASIEREMQQFLRAFPRASVAAAVRTRLRALTGGRSNVRLRCLSG
jgi:hypothetical protein